VASRLVSVEIKGGMDGVSQGRLLGGQEVADLGPSAASGTVTMLSQLITEAWPRPLRRPTGTSVDSPRIVVVIGATVTRVR
jgi:hypothetical protein